MTAILRARSLAADSIYAMLHAALNLQRVSASETVACNIACNIAEVESNSTFATLLGTKSGGATLTLTVASNFCAKLHCVLIEPLETNLICHRL